MPVIYLDVLIVVNWFIDYLLLSLTARLLRLTIRRRRVVLGALMGGLGACQILLTLPVVPLLLLHLAVAVLMQWIAFPRCSLRDFFCRTVVLVCLSALLSGLVTALWWLTDSEVVLTHNGVIYFDVSPLMLTAFSLVSYGVIRLYERITTRVRAPVGLEYVLTIRTDNGTCRCRALYDTGLHLREPFSGSPAVVACRRTLMPLLPPEWQNVLDGEAEPSLRVPLRWIPYRSVGKEGLLLAFAPPQVTLQRLGSPPRDVTGVYVALSDTLERGAYTALVGSDVVNL